MREQDKLAIAKLRMAGFTVEDTSQYGIKRVTAEGVYALYNYSGEGGVLYRGLSRTVEEFLELVTA